MFPTVHLKMDDTSPRLDWVEIVRYNRAAGEVLVACELFLLTEGGELLPKLQGSASTPGQRSHFLVPDEIKPKLETKRIDVRELIRLSTYTWL